MLFGFAVLAVALALLNDREFFVWMSDFASRKALWTNLPTWIRDLELPAKRIEKDFVAFLIVMSLGVALVSFRRRAAWCFVGLPRPGVAASAAAAIVLLVHGVGVKVRHWSRPVGFSHLSIKVIPPYWYFGLESFSIATEVAASILGIWTYLILARRWKARDDWRDWLGRWVGWCWISLVCFDVLTLVTWG